MNAILLFQGRIQPVPDPVAEQAHGQGGNEDGDARQHGDPPGRGQVIPPESQHVAQAGEWRLNAEAEKAERGLHQHRPGEVERHVDDQGTGDIGQNMPRVYPQRRSPQRGDRHRITVGAGRQRQSAGAQEQVF